MAKKKAKKAGKKRKPNAAFMKAMTPSGPLAAVVGSSAMPRTEVTKKIWGYIKRNGLQDKKNRRMINADDKLKAGVRRQGPGVDVRDDQAGQQAPEVTGFRRSTRKGPPRGALFISGGSDVTRSTSFFEPSTTAQRWCRPLGCRSRMRRARRRWPRRPPARR